MEKATKTLLVVAIIAVLVTVFGFAFELFPLAVTSEETTPTNSSQTSESVQQNANRDAAPEYVYVIRDNRPDEHAPAHEYGETDEGEASETDLETGAENNKDTGGNDDVKQNG